MPHPLRETGQCCAFPLAAQIPEPLSGVFHGGEEVCMGDMVQGLDIDSKTEETFSSV